MLRQLLSGARALGPPLSRVNALESNGLLAIEGSQVSQKRFLNVHEYQVRFLKNNRSSIKSGPKGPQISEKVLVGLDYIASDALSFHSIPSGTILWELVDAQSGLLPSVLEYKVRCS